MKRKRSSPLHHLANFITAELQRTPPTGCKACGTAALHLLPLRPNEALALAKEQVQNVPYREVKGHWLRYYEDACLHQAAAQLRDDEGSERFGEVTTLLDHALIVTGGTGRRELFTAVFARLEDLVGKASFDEIPPELPVIAPSPLESAHSVPKAEALSLEAFQLHLDRKTTPLLLRGVIDDWPAMQTWRSTAHLLRLTIGGQRCVPIEIGESYTHANWRQEIMPFHIFMRKYLLPEQPDEIGYLGQHNLLQQIPQFGEEVWTPDLCYASPPETTPISRADLEPVALVDEPQRNAWLGPKGTRTPLHTDPYHNIFCQVVGYKYVRVYPPEATDAVYPRGTDENGINESNTSQVDFALDRDVVGNIRVLDADQYPRFVQEASYLEAMVGPGECLYIPAGWWHFVESMTTSFSVSFWWN